MIPRPQHQLLWHARPKHIAASEPAHDLNITSARTHHTAGIDPCTTLQGIWSSRRTMRQAPDFQVDARGLGHLRGAAAECAPDSIELRP